MAEYLTFGCYGKKKKRDFASWIVKSEVVRCPWPNTVLGYIETELEFLVRVSLIVCSRMWLYPVSQYDLNRLLEILS